MTPTQSLRIAEMMNEAERLCDQAGFFHLGKCFRVGSLHEVPIADLQGFIRGTIAMLVEARLSITPSTRGLFDAVEEHLRKLSTRVWSASTNTEIYKDNE